MSDAMMVEFDDTDPTPAKDFNELREKCSSLQSDPDHDRFHRAALLLKSIPYYIYANFGYTLPDDLEALRENAVNLSQTAGEACRLQADLSEFPQLPDSITANKHTVSQIRTENEKYGAMLVRKTFQAIQTGIDSLMEQANGLETSAPLKKPQAIYEIKKLCQKIGESVKDGLARGVAD